MTTRVLVRQIKGDRVDGTLFAVTERSYAQHLRSLVSYPNIPDNLALVGRGEYTHRTGHDASGRSTGTFVMDGTEYTVWSDCSAKAKR